MGKAVSLIFSYLKDSCRDLNTWVLFPDLITAVYTPTYAIDRTVKYIFHVIVTPNTGIIASINYNRLHTIL